MNFLHLASYDLDGSTACDKTNKIAEITTDIDQVTCPRCIQWYRSHANDFRGGAPGRTRIELGVYVDLDPMLGTFNDADSAKSVIRAILNQQLGHYNPDVRIVSRNVAAPAPTPPTETLFDGVMDDLAKAKQDLEAKLEGLDPAGDELKRLLDILGDLLEERAKQ